MRRVLIMGAGGRDFHDFATVFRDDIATKVVAFTAAQIPYISNRTYPGSLAGPRYPDGIPIVGEEHLAEVIRAESVDEVILSYSDLAYSDVMHRAGLVEAAGADFRLLAPTRTMLECRQPVIAVCAVRTGSGKSQISREIGRLVRANGMRPALVRHPMPYGHLESMVVQRFATAADIDAASPTIEEREEYEPAVEAGLVVHAGVDYAAIRDRVDGEADVIIWDGGNNDTPFFRPDLWMTVCDALRPGHETGYHPGEVNLRCADVVIVNKVDAADPADVAAVEATVHAVNPDAVLVRAASPVTLDPGPPLRDRRVVVVEDGPTVTHGGMHHGAGYVAAADAGAVVVDPRPFACGSIADTYRKWPATGPVLPAMGYAASQVADLAATLDACDVDAVVAGTPVDLARIVATRHPVRRARYAHADAGHPTLAEVLAPHLVRWQAQR